MSNNCLRVCNPTFPNAPIFMSDGRLFTDYRSAKSVISSEKISNIEDYKNKLTNNAEVIMNQNLNHAQTISVIYNCEGTHGEGVSNPNNCVSNINDNVVESYNNIHNNLNNSCNL